jgi:hypothetical protein
LETFQARHVEISSDREQPRELDGDLIEPSHTLTAAVRPAALCVCVPQPPFADSGTGPQDIQVPAMSRAGAKPSANREGNDDVHHPREDVPPG